MTLAYCLMLFILIPFSVSAETVKSTEEIDFGAKEEKSSRVIFGQKVEHAIPDGWKMAFESSSKNSHIIKFIPYEDSLENWNEMFTVKGIWDASGRLSPKELLNVNSKIYARTCSDKSVFELLDKKKISGFDSQSGIMGCVSVKEDLESGVKKVMGEIVYYIIIKGIDDMYTFNKSVKSDNFDLKSPPFSKGDNEDFISEFFPIRLCDINSRKCIK